MNLRPAVGDFSGLLVVGDIHSHITAFTEARNYATEHNLFLVMLGDLVDGMDHPMQTMTLAYDLLESSAGALVIGNHDDKFYRFSLGNPVKLSWKQQDTLDCCDDVEDFKKLYSKIVTHSLSDMYHVCDDVVMIHGATHSSIWEYPEKLKEPSKSFALYGSVTGERDPDGMPIRTYEWIDDIPSGKSVIVGHARDALGKNKLEVSMRSNASGGTAYFIDTSCGKDVSAPLSGLVVDFNPRCDIRKVIKFYGCSSSR